MDIRFLEVAQKELDEAIDYYNYELSGLGKVLLSEALNALDRIVKHPETWHLYSRKIRRCQLRRFPCGIIYQIRETEILVIAVAHLHRRPSYWQDLV
jgi:toxin ParE2